MNPPFYLFLFIFLLSCQPYKGRRIDLEQLNFSTIDPAELFFKNVRQLYYEKEEWGEAKLDVYRYKDLNPGEDYPTINPAIVINWYSDQAYILLEPNAFFAGAEKIEVSWNDRTSNQSGSYPLSLETKETQLLWASQVYLSLQKNHQMKILIDNQEFDFLTDQLDSENFRITLFDFYRLVGLL